MHETFPLDVHCLSLLSCFLCQGFLYDLTQSVTDTNTDLTTQWQCYSRCTTGSADGCQGNSSSPKLTHVVLTQADQQHYQNTGDGRHLPLLSTPLLFFSVFCVCTELKTECDSRLSVSLLSVCVSSKCTSKELRGATQKMTEGHR